ncbi:MAG: PhnD/SsuA/transferrin family substrate-binding protein [Thermodesulfobacteriota bacterium]
MTGNYFHILKWMFLAWLLPAVSLAQQFQTTPSSAMNVLVCYPGGSIRTQDAQSAMGSMLRALEETGGWTAGTMKGLFATEINDCTKILSDQKPQFAITTLGIFLESREKLNLIPLVQPRIKGSSSDIYRIVVRQGTFKSIEELKGKTLGGPLVAEPTFLKRVIFQGKVDPLSFFELKGSRRVLRSLRDVAKGKLDAVIINAQQHSALSSLPFVDELQVVFTSEEIPLVGVVANGQRTTAGERNRFSRALSKMCTHQDGKPLCELFGVEAFVPVDMTAFGTVFQLWDSTR